MKRSAYCGAFTQEYIDKKSKAMGWVDTIRDMGGIIFIDLRDREGILQVVFNSINLSESSFATAKKIRCEDVICAEGIIALRDEETYNPKINTGSIELRVDLFEILSQAETMPFPVEDDINVSDALRMKYRYLDIRRKKMLDNLKFRHRVQSIIRSYLDNAGFIDVETPILTKSTPEGARDYLVPSRVHQGEFYALPQSPQIFKQLLMVGGIDKYYQIAKCFRDEDLRADRQPEFTQVDMEMSFVEQEDILVFLEETFKHIFKEIMGHEIRYDFPRITWKDAMDIYGSDKPDLRFGLPIIDLTIESENCGFNLFETTVKNNGVVRAINVKGGSSFTRATIDELTMKCISFGAKGMAWIEIENDGSVHSILTKYFSTEKLDIILNKLEAKAGDFVLFCADELDTVRSVLGNIRLYIADMLELRNKDEFNFLFVTDFPQFEYSKEEKRYVSTHHPFTMPYEEDIQYLKSDPSRVRAQAYDVVLNGVELGSGSIRIHRSDVQQSMFEALGLSQEQIRNRFGFMVNAFKYGTPPHGGFAFGLDRFVMLLLNADSLREVIAFPKTKDASCPLTNAPDFVDDIQLDILGISTAESLKKSSQDTSPNKASVKKIDVMKVAQLSKLYLTKNEKISMGKELSEIIGFANQLNEIDTSGISAMEHLAQNVNVFRKDTIENEFNREELLANAPNKNDEYIIVPKVVE